MTLLISYIQAWASSPGLQFTRLQFPFLSCKGVSQHSDVQNQAYVQAHRPNTPPTAFHLALPTHPIWHQLLSFLTLSKASPTHHSGTAHWLQQVHTSARTRPLQGLCQYLNPPSPSGHLCHKALYAHIVPHRIYERIQIIPITNGRLWKLHNHARGFDMWYCNVVSQVLETFPFSTVALM